MLNLFKCSTLCLYYDLSLPRVLFRQKICRKYRIRMCLPKVSRTQKNPKADYYNLKLLVCFSNRDRHATTGYSRAVLTARCTVNSNSMAISSPIVIVDGDPLTPTHSPTGQWPRSLSPSLPPALLLGPYLRSTPRHVTLARVFTLSLSLAMWLSLGSFWPHGSLSLSRFLVVVSCLVS